jgi:flagellar biosynthesis protein FliP
MRSIRKSSVPRRRSRTVTCAACVLAALALIPGGLFGQQGNRNGASARVAPNSAVTTAADERADVPFGRFERQNLRPANAEAPGPAAPAEGINPLPGGIQPEQLVSPGGLSSTLNLMVLLTVLSLAPSIMIMTTCFIRFVIVLGLLRQALGTQQLPPNQVLVALSLFLTFLVMSPVWKQGYEEGIRPYTQPAAGMAPPTLETTFTRTVAPLRRFMFDQIEYTNNGDTLLMLIDYEKPAPDSAAARTYRAPEKNDDVPLPTLMSAFMLSELKTAFLIGFQIYLPFLIIDMVVSTVLMSMGMMMLPPTLVSFPFKLLLFVLIDGWALTVQMMLASVTGGGG